MYHFSADKSAKGEAELGLLYGAPPPTLLVTERRDIHPVLAAGVRRRSSHVGNQRCRAKGF